jgi:hypothetical protein
VDEASLTPVRGANKKISFSHRTPASGPSSTSQKPLVKKTKPSLVTPDTPLYDKEVKQRRFHQMIMETTVAPQMGSHLQTPVRERVRNNLVLYPFLFLCFLLRLLLSKELPQLLLFVEDL